MYKCCAFPLWNLWKTISNWINSLPDHFEIDPLNALVASDIQFNQAMAIWEDIRKGWDQRLARKHQRQKSHMDFGGQIVARLDVDCYHQIKSINLFLLNLSFNSQPSFNHPCFIFFQGWEVSYSNRWNIPSGPLFLNMGTDTPNLNTLLKTHCNCISTSSITIWITSASASF